MLQEYKLHKIFHKLFGSFQLQIGPSKPGVLCGRITVMHSLDEANSQAAVIASCD